MDAVAVAETHSRFQRACAAGQSLWTGFVDWLTPPRCLDCKSPVSTGASLCISCWQKLTLISEPVCDALGTPFEYDQGEGALSPAAIADPPPWDKARAAVAFDDHSKHLVHLLKYRDIHEAGIAMAHMMLGPGRKLLGEADLILPVPLHRKRLWERRFNQAAVLTHTIARLTQRDWHHDVLLRDVPTRQQVGLSAVERRKNVRKAFRVPFEKQGHVAGKTVLLIDDVRTTGATAAACARSLKEAGAARVFVLTFALVLTPIQLHIEA